MEAPVVRVALDGPGTYRLLLHFALSRVFPSTAVRGPPHLQGSVLRVYSKAMPRQHPRRRLRKAAHALGVGTALAIAKSASASWHHALVEQRCPAFLSNPYLGARSGSRGNCNRPAESLGVLSTTPPPAVVPGALTMKSSDDRGPGTQGRFGKGKSPQKGSPSRGASTSGRVSHAASQRAGPLKATSMLLHDEPVRCVRSSSIQLVNRRAGGVGGSGQA